MAETSTEIMVLALEWCGGRPAADRTSLHHSKLNAERLKSLTSLHQDVVGNLVYRSVSVTDLGP
jgi:hypothetical protein